VVSCWCKRCLGCKEPYHLTGKPSQFSNALTLENGLLNGTRLVYYQNGEKQVDETYQFGMVTGLVKNYYEDGKLLSESYYRGNRQHGLYTSYYPNGKIKEQGE
jgi:uncharacterized protein